ncbi:hypothetical protein CapIbe_023998 [Capra ibex]
MGAAGPAGAPPQRGPGPRRPRPPPVTFTTDRTERGPRRDAARLVALDSSVPPVFQGEEKMPWAHSQRGPQAWPRL